MQINTLTSTLHQKFVNSPPYTALLSKVIRGAAQIHVSGLSESARSLVLSMLSHEVKRPIFMIVEDNHRASRYLQEISNLSQYPVSLYPASEVSPYEQVLTSADTMTGQMGVLQELLHDPHAPRIVILPARSLLQRVMPPQLLSSETIKIKRGQALPSDRLASQMVRMGYSRVNLVTMAGEFSVRGDIVDIYPSAGMPARIELFGDEVESIRTFDVDSQRSINEEEEVAVPPRWWIVIDNPNELASKIQQLGWEAMKDMDDERADTLRAVINSDCAAIAAHQYPEASEYYALFADPRFATVVDYLPNDCLVILDEWDGLSLTLRSIEEKFAAVMEEGLSSGRLAPLPRPLHAHVRELVPKLMEKQRVYVSVMGESGEQGSDETTHFECHGVERFNNQIQQFVEKVRDYKHTGYRVIISTEQPQRVLGILKEWDTPAVYLASGVGSTSDQSVSGTNTILLTELMGRNGGASSANIDQDIAKNKVLDSQDINITPDSQDINEASNSLDIKVDAQGVRFIYDPNEVWVTRDGFLGGFDLSSIHLVSLTDAEIFGTRHKPSAYRRPVNEKSYERISSVADLKIGDYVVHTRQGIGQFIGVQRIVLDKEQREYLTIQYLGDDRLYVPVDQVNLISRYRGAGDAAPRLSRMGGSEWESTKRRVKRSVRQIAEDLTNLYALRSKQEGFSCSPDTPWQYEMEEAFPYDETPDQWRAIVEVKKDLESIRPTDRLICGDVGFGKTEVALRAIFKVIMSGKQAAVLVPTTILAQQHFNTLSERFAPYPIKIGLLSRFRTASEQREITKRLSQGNCDVVVGTHRLLQKDVSFKDLGLVVIDEEQRFGVSHKEKLKQLRVMVDVITMSATPIPRTLHMALSGARDMSLINTAPANRMPIKTFVGEYKAGLVRTTILHEIERGGQIYFVHNRIETIENVAYELQQLVPEARITIGHGQMQEGQLENVMLDVFNHRVDVLLCTTIIESGLDIPNVNTIIIDEADRLGLAQLYQLRGRVGRSNVQAYAYCLIRPDKILTDVAQSRLRAIREFTSLGSGYQIALRDMEIRGVGNILGAEQHGHMVAVGYDLYVKLLEESVAEIKGEFTPVESSTQIDINITAFIPDSYMADSDQKIVEYKRLADVRDEHELMVLLDEWRDRFGVMPREVEQLVSIVRLRLIATRAGVSAIRPDPVGLRLSLDLRLQKWLPIQSRLPKHLSSRTAYKPGSSVGQGGTSTSPYILVRCLELTPPEQVSMLQELLSDMVSQPVMS